MLKSIALLTFFLGCWSTGSEMGSKQVRGQKAEVRMRRCRCERLKFKKRLDNAVFLKFAEKSKRKKIRACLILVLLMNQK